MILPKIPHVLAVVAIFIAFQIGSDVFAQDEGLSASPETESRFAVEQQDLDDLKEQLRLTWPKNRLVRFVFHGHSVPAGYFRGGNVRRFDSYPILFHQALCKRYPTAVIDVCITAIGGENSLKGSKRFAEEVLSLRPDVIFIDYCLNDRAIGVEVALASWRSMVEQALHEDVKVVPLATESPEPKRARDRREPDTHTVRVAVDLLRRPFYP